MVNTVIKVPNRLIQKLSENKQWHANVMNIIENVNDIYSRTPDFFPEYTEHGYKHVNNILNISDCLISDITLKHISARTLGVYLIAAILHDIGMYTTYDTFNSIITNDNTKIDLLDDIFFKSSWKQYLSEIKRYSDKQILRKFGTLNIKFESFKEEIDLSQKDKLIIGEFLRQNHHKLSHYLVNGLFKLGEFDLLQNLNISEKEKDIIGLVTRSHGMEIRDLEEYLNAKYSVISKPINIDVFYIMSLLRISDYLDAGEERASHIIEEMYVKHSQVSKEEFSWNQCLRYDEYIWNYDKKTISVDASPNNANQFVKITKWVESVQKELDLCWAIIGEYYDNNYQFNVRRFDTNILKKEVINEYEKNFYTKEAYFKANPDILKLLIEPLYGNNPSFGVRELLQNAVDACREREEIEKSKKPNYSGKVIINLDIKNKCFTISDNGIGMNINTIVNYFLVAGSSFRRSDTWCKNFLDSEGESTVLRNGKFGIGVLATFLLGDRATIITRNINDDLGWKFDIKLDQDNININRIEIEDYGTTITIPLTNNVIKKFENQFLDNLKWYEWYEDDSPEVIYMKNGKQFRIKNKKQRINFLMEQTLYQSFRWEPSFKEKPITIYNGIIILDMPRFFHVDNYYKFGCRIKVPTIKIEDKNAILPINLARTELLKIPCKEELYIECCKYILAQLLMMDKETILKDNMFITSIFESNLIYSKHGYYINERRFLKHSGVTNVNGVTVNSDNLEKEKFFSKSSEYFEFYLSFNPIISKGYFENKLALAEQSNCFIDGYNYFMKYMYIDKESYEDVKDVLINHRWDFLNIQKIEDYYIIFQKNLSKKDELKYNNCNFKMLCEYDIEVINLDKNDIMMNVLKQYFPPNTFIPYDFEERKKVFAKAFKELKKYM